MLSRFAIAVKVTAVPEVYEVEHVVPQEIPVGDEATVPPPPLVTESV